MTRTFSKAYGLAGLRLGWCYAPVEVVDVRNRLRGPFNVSAAAQAAGVAALHDQAFLREVQNHNRRWLPWLTEQLTQLGLTPVPSHANFILVQFPGGAVEASAANAHLVNDGILVRQMDSYGLHDCLRITIGPAKSIEALVGSLRSFTGRAA